MQRRPMRRAQQEGLPPAERGPLRGRATSRDEYWITRDQCYSDKIAKGVSMSLNRRAVITSALATAAFGVVPATAIGDETPATILQLHRRSIEVNGRSASVFGIHQPDGTAGITMSVGDRFRVRVENQIDAPSLIHWHGMTPPWRQDGVPGISGPPIPPGKSADYDFPLRFGGTFWMHSHQGLQEQLLMTAPLIIHDGRDEPDQQEVVLMLHDFIPCSPQEPKILG
jgi:FtsP/CotA-like multicopper oxidase with cupredoxin domain